MGTAFVLKGVRGNPNMQKYRDWDDEYRRLADLAWFRFGAEEVENPGTLLTFTQDGDGIRRLASARDADTVSDVVLSAAGVAQPQFVAPDRGQPFLRFDGDNDRLGLAGATLAVDAGFSVLLVMRPMANGVANRFVWGNLVATNSDARAIVSDANRYRFYWGNNSITSGDVYGLGSAVALLASADGAGNIWMRTNVEPLLNKTGIGAPATAQPLGIVPPSRGVPLFDLFEYRVFPCIEGGAGEAARLIVGNYLKYRYGITTSLLTA